jgi:hypothetical protein
MLYFDLLMKIIKLLELVKTFGLSRSGPEGLRSLDHWIRSPALYPS